MREGDLFDNLPDPEEEKTAAQPEPAPVAELDFEAAPLPEPEAGPEVPAEDETPEPEAAPEPPPPPQVHYHTVPTSSGTLGQTMTELRRARGLELRDVADETRIKSCYLQALEEDRFDELPHMVYVLAYVKKLCALYGVSDADTEELVAGLREQLAYEIPEDIDKSVICREQDEENRRKLQQITISLIAGAALIVLLLVIGATTLILRSQRPKGEPEDAEMTLSESWFSGHRKPLALTVSPVSETPPRR